MTRKMVCMMVCCVGILFHANAALCMDIIMQKDERHSVWREKPSFMQEKILTIPDDILTPSNQSEIVKKAGWAFNRPGEIICVEEKKSSLHSFLKHTFSNSCSLTFQYHSNTNTLIVGPPQITEIHSMDFVVAAWIILFSVASLICGDFFNLRPSYQDSMKQYENDKIARIFYRISLLGMLVTCCVIIIGTIKIIVIHQLFSGQNILYCFVTCVLALLSTLFTGFVNDKSGQRNINILSYLLMSILFYVLI